MIALGYGAAYIDRVNISFASLQMNRDLHFTATIYGFMFWLSAVILSWIDFCGRQTIAARTSTRPK